MAHSVCGPAGMGRAMLLRATSSGRRLPRQRVPLSSGGPRLALHTALRPRPAFASATSFVASARSVEKCAALPDGHFRTGTTLRRPHEALHRRSLKACVVAAAVGERGLAPAAEVTVVGAGAAGLTAAYFAAQSGAKVTVLERTKEPGKKILMSGGTRCNVMPAEVDIAADYFTESPMGAMRAIFKSWSPEECFEWLRDPEQVGLEMALEESTRKYFPVSNSSRDVRDSLVDACRRRGVEFRFHASLSGMRATDEGLWECQLADGSSHVSRTVIVATGGMSFPVVGTDGAGHRIMRKLGTHMQPTYPALTPLEGAHPGEGTNLQGISMDVDVQVVSGKTKKKKKRSSPRTGFLFTRKGYSGPSILDVSHKFIMPLTRGEGEGVPKLRINFSGMDANEWNAVLDAPGRKLLSTLVREQGVPRRLADALIADLGQDPEEFRADRITKGMRAKLVEMLTSFALPVNGHEGYKKAEVTGGGVRLDNLDCRTMECKTLPGVHLCGEILDVFGRIGGFNFYWAWVSGRLAGVGAAEAALAGTGSPGRELQGAA